MTEIEFDLTKVSNLDFDGIDHKDYPDYCDAYVCSADYGDHAMPEEELSHLQDNYSDWCYEKLWDYLH